MVRSLCAFLCLSFCRIAAAVPLSFIPQDLGGHPEFMAAENVRSVMDVTEKWSRKTGGPSDLAVYGLETSLPAEWQGRRVFLWLDNAWPAVDIRVNDKAIGQFLHCDHVYGCVEITSTVRPGQSNRIEVRMLPESVNGITDKHGKGSQVAPSKALQPEGAFYSDSDKGIPSQFYGRQFLIATARACVAWVKIDPVVAGKTIRLTGAVTGDGAGTGELAAELYEIGIRPEPRLVTEYRPECVSRATRRLAAGATSFALDLPFPKDAKLWTPDHPFLYLVKVKLLADGKVTDVFTDRTGLRTVGIRGDQFTLNGQLFLPRLYFSNRSAVRSNWDFDNLVAHVVRSKTYHYNLHRNHVAPAGRLYYPIADQYGVGAISQPAPVSVTYDQPDHPCWEYWKQAAARMYRQNGNSPSVLMWSAENEILSARKYVDRSGETHKKMWEVHDFMKTLDSRPVMFEGDGDLRGHVEVYNEHYPFRYGEYLWPADFYWLKKPHIANNADIRSRGTINLAALKKPIIFGETMWFPTGGPVADVAFVGDKMYEWFAAYPQHNWRTPDGLSNHDMLARAYNIQKVAAFVVMNSGAQSHYVKYHFNNPTSLFLKEEFRHYFGGDPVKRTYVVCNTSDADRQLRVRGQLTWDGRQIAAAAEDLTVRAGDRVVREMTLAVPKVGRARSAVLRFDLYEGDELKDTTEQTLKVFPRERAFTPSPGRVGVLDPSGRTLAVLKKLNVNAVAVSRVTPDTLKDLDLLIIGEGAVTSRNEISPKAIADFLDQGKNILVLAQKPGVNLNWLPLQMELSASRPATMTHVVTPHDLLRIRNLAEGDFQWWLDDNFVARCCYRKPFAGNVRFILDTGTVGLDYAALMEIFSGKGTVILNQLACVEKFDTAPVAAEILFSCVEYGLTASRTMGTLAVVGPMDASLRDRLGKLRASFELLSADQITEKNLCRFSAVLIPPTAEAWSTASAKSEELRQWVFRHGGTVLVHRIDPAVVPEDNVSGLVTPWQITMGPRQKRKIQIHKLSEAMDDELACGLSNECLWWIPGSIRRPNELKGQPERIIDYPVGLNDKTRFPNDDWRELVSSGALCHLKFGRGTFLFDQIRWDVNQELMDKQLEYLRWLLTSCRVKLGPTLGTQIDPAKVTFVPIDLRSVCNRALADDGSRNSWFGFGPHQDLRTMPTGRRTLADVACDIIDPKSNGGKGCLVLHGEGGEQFPRRAGPIRVNGQFTHLAFHQTSAYGRPGDVLGTYEITYAGGKTVLVRVVEGRQVADWWDGRSLLAEANPAWVGPVSDGHEVATYLYLWTNPHPNRTIESIMVHASDPTQKAGDAIIRHGMLAVLSITGVR